MTLKHALWNRDFSWSPTDNIIAYWVPEESNTPARVTLIDVPSRNELCVRNLFNVADAKMHWQKSGDHLCVKVDRYSKAKKDEKDQFKYSVSSHSCWCHPFCVCGLSSYGYELLILCELVGLFLFLLLLLLLLFLHTKCHKSPMIP